MIAYLAHISDFEKQDVLDWWKTQSFDLEIPEHLGNCVFCIKKSLLKVALAAKDEPELAGEFTDMIYGERALDKGHPQMYRGKRSLGQVIAMFEDSTRGEIANRVRSAKQYDTNSCSESCEPFADM